MRLIAALVLLLLPGLVTAQDITLSWDASPTAATTGYKVYYQPAPYVPDQWNGTAATQGTSPIDVGDVLTYQLTNLTDDTVYYFTVTATDGENESVYSNIVSSSIGGRLHLGGTGRLLIGGSGRVSF